MKNKKGNALGLILVLIFALIIITIYSKHYHEPIDTISVKYNDLINQIDDGIRLSVEQGLNEFILDGFSDNVYWYCNKAYPLSSLEYSNNLKDYIKKSFSNYKKILRQEGFSVDDISFSISNNLETVEVNIDEFKVGIKNNDINSYNKYNYDLNYDYPILKMYDGFYSWIDDDAGNLISNIYENVFFDKKCQAVSSGCSCNDGTLIDENFKDELRIDIEDVYDALDESLENLNSEFDKIKCDYEIKEYRIENLEKFNYSNSNSSNINFTTILLDYDNSIYDYGFFEYEEDHIKPIGCEVGINDDHLFDEEIFVDVEGVCNGDGVKNEYFAMDKRLSLLVSFYCYDENVEVINPDDLNYLTSKVDIYLSIGQNCPLPYNYYFGVGDQFSC